MKLHKKRKDNEDINKMSEREKNQEIKLLRNGIDYFENSVAVWQQREINNLINLNNKYEKEVERKTEEAIFWRTRFLDQKKDLNLDDDSPRLPW